MDRTHQEAIEQALRDAGVNAFVDSLLSGDDNDEEKVGHVDIRAGADEDLSYGKVLEALARLGMLHGIDANDSHKGRGIDWPAFVIVVTHAKYVTLRDETAYRQVEAKDWWARHDDEWEEPPF